MCTPPTSRWRPSISGYVLGGAVGWGMAATGGLSISIRLGVDLFLERVPDHIVNGRTKLGESAVLVTPRLMTNLIGQADGSELRALGSC